MVERPSDPTQSVRLPHGVGRLPDGDRIPHPPRPQRVSWHERARVALAAVIGALR